METDRGVRRRRDMERQRTPDSPTGHSPKGTVPARNKKGDILDRDSQSITSYGYVPGNITRIHCPRKCGWYRDYTHRVEWLTKSVDHPTLGLISEKDLVTHDIQHHECRETANAKIRLHIRREINAKTAA